MIVSAQELENGEVISLEGGDTLGLIRMPIIDPKNGQVLAFDIRVGFLTHRAILPFSEIIDWTHLSLLVRDENSLFEPEKQKKIFNFIKKRIKIIGLRAETEDGTKLGKVTDVFIDSISGIVAKYVVGHSILFNFTEEGQILPSSSVIKIEKKKIIFKDTATKLEKSKAPKEATA